MNNNYKFIKKCIIGQRFSINDKKDLSKISKKGQKYIKRELFIFVKALDNNSCNLIHEYCNILKLLLEKNITENQFLYIKSECISMLWDNILRFELKSIGESTIHNDSINIITGQMLKNLSTNYLDLHPNNKEIQSQLDDLYTISDKIKTRRRHILVKMYNFVLNVLKSVKENVELYHNLHILMSKYVKQNLFLLMKRK